MTGARRFWVALAQVVLIAAPVTFIYGVPSLAFALKGLADLLTLMGFGPDAARERLAWIAGLLEVAGVLALLGIAGMWAAFVCGPVLRRRGGRWAQAVAGLIACGIAATACVTGFGVLNIVYASTANADGGILAFLLTVLSVPWALSAYGAWHIRLLLCAPRPGGA
ncbi:MAG TPA: hypothetical protein DDX54_02310 [Rhodospirillaceae bacterium]|jgi:hypothetical protein|nr:hypothetical protein [Alphaproteobacteria bacterium]HBH26218.1 hypothetical protein [Rhodospirillaceae bacterium]